MDASGSRAVYALQHCMSEYLGALEDHLEGRGIRFQYVRPFASGGQVPATAFAADGLILIGGGAWGAAPGPRQVPSLDSEVRLTRDFLARKRPVLAWGLGAQILCLAAGGGVVPGPLVFAVAEARRTGIEAGLLPERFPLILHVRDRAVPPPEAEILATLPDGAPACFRLRGNCLAFAGHPGAKSGLLEDLVMEFDDAVHDLDGAPADPALVLARARVVEGALADALVPIAAWAIETTGLMRPLDDAERKRRGLIPIRR